MLTPEIYVNITFYPTDKGGRKLPTGSHFLGTIFVINESKHECRLLLEEVGPISPGESKNEVPIKFLCPDLVLSKLRVGTKFYLWDMRNIAEGEVVKIINTNKELGKV